MPKSVICIKMTVLFKPILKCVVLLADEEQDVLLKRVLTPQPFHLEDFRKINTFTVASYNILADCHAQKSGYKFISAEHLSSTYRHQRLMTEFKFLDCDVFCLQEVGTSYFKDILQPAMTVYVIPNDIWAMFAQICFVPNICVLETFIFTHKVTIPMY